MILYIVIAFLGAGFIYYFLDWIDKQNNIAEIFRNKRSFKLNTVVLFSHKQFIKNLKKYCSNNNKVMVKFDEATCLTLKLSKPETELVKQMRSYMYNHDVKHINFKNLDSITCVIFDIWKEHGHKDDYSKILKRILNNKLARDKISMSMYKAVCQRAFRYQSKNN